MSPYLPYLFPLFFTGIWVLVTFKISTMGWAKLAERYKNTNLNFQGTRVGTISANINMVRYNNSLALYYNHEGLLLKPLLVFRMFHPPLFIPWSEIRNVEEKKAWLFKTATLVLNTTFFVSITLRQSVYEQFKPNYLLHSHHN